MTLDKLPGTTQEEYKRWERREKRKREKRERESKRVEVTRKKKKSKGAGRSGKKRKGKKKVELIQITRYGTVQYGRCSSVGSEAASGRDRSIHLYSRVLISNIYYYYLELIIYNSESILYFIILVLMLRSTSYSIGLTVLQNIGTAARPDKVRGQLVLSRYPCRIQRRKSDLVGTLFPDLVC